MTRLGPVLGLGALLAAGPTLADGDTAIKRVNGVFCYDQLVVGTVRRYLDWVDLNDLHPGELWIGGRYDMKVEVEEVLEGGHLPRKIVVRAFMTSQRVLPVEMLFYVQRLDSGVYWAPEWLRLDRDGAGREIRSDQPPPRCPA